MTVRKRTVLMSIVTMLIMAESIFLTGTQTISAHEDDAVTVTLCDSYRSTLTRDERTIYDAILQSVRNCMDGNERLVETDVPLDDHDLISKIAHMVLYDHPEYGTFWNTSLSIHDKHFIKATTTDRQNDVVPDDLYVKLAKRYAGSTRTETARNVFRYFASTVRYDSDYGTNTHWNDDYAAMIGKLSCCQEISFAYKRTMDAAGIPCQVATCYTESDGYHMVNVICLNDEWQFVDLTSAIAYPEHLSRYFLINENDIHTIARKLVYLPRR